MRLRHAPGRRSRIIKRHDNTAQRQIVGFAELGTCKTFGRRSIRAPVIHRKMDAHNQQELPQCLKEL